MFLHEGFRNQTMADQQPSCFLPLDVLCPSCAVHCQSSPSQYHQWTSIELDMEGETTRVQRLGRQCQSNHASIMIDGGVNGGNR